MAGQTSSTAFDCAKRISVSERFDRSETNHCRIWLSQLRTMFPPRNKNKYEKSNVSISAATSINLGDAIGGEFDLFYTNIVIPLLELCSSVTVDTLDLVSV